MGEAVLGSHADGEHNGLLAVRTSSDSISLERQRLLSSCIGIGTRQLQAGNVKCSAPVRGGMFKIKICGITRAADAATAIRAGADAVGLNFYPLSRRHLSLDAAVAVSTSLPAPVVKVGVFVNSSVKEITEIAGRVGLQCLQLHGDEPAGLIAGLPSHVSVISAYRCGPQGLAPLAEYLDQCRQHGRAPEAVLIDAETEATDEYGGTGRVANWERIAHDRKLLGDMPLILAGGLTPDNVAEAIDTVRPGGVDVAGGVESRPGHKDSQLVERFVSAARDAFIRYD